MKNMKKGLTILLALTVAGAMSSVVMAETASPAEPTVAEAPADHAAQLIVNTEGQGQVALEEDGGEPVFDDDFPLQSLYHSAEAGTVVKVGAKADEGWKFAYWMNGEKIFSTDAVIEVTLSGETNLVAVFVQDVETVLVTVKSVEFEPGVGGGQIAMSDDGTDPVFDDEHPCTDLDVNIPLGETVIFAAKPDEGSKFVGWFKKDTFEMLSNETTLRVEGTEAMTIFAVFDLDAPRYRVSLSVDMPGTGEIAATMDGSEPEFVEGCPYQSLVFNVLEGHTISAAAKANEGFLFAYWMDSKTGDIVSFDAAITIDVTRETNLTAAFLDLSFFADIQISTEGHGQIDASVVWEADEEPDAAFDPDYPEYSFKANVMIGTPVYMRAKPDEGWQFDGWKDKNTGVFVSTDEEFEYTVEADTELVAVFSLIPTEPQYDPSHPSQPSAPSTPSTPSTPVGPGNQPVKTGDMAPTCALIGIIAASLTAAAVLGAKRKKED